jgi:hypothetical protein
VLASAASIAAVAGAVVGSGGGGVPARLPKGALHVSVSGTTRAREIAPGFVGLSIEYPSAPIYLGAAAGPAFDNLVRALTPGQSPVLRIGGDTTDWTWWPTPGVAKPPGIRYTLDSSWVQSVRASAQRLNARLILGVNFEADSSAIAAAESRALLNGIGRQYIAGLELGNEPEVYGTLGWYRRDGHGVPGRPSTYDVAAYLNDYSVVSTAVPTTVPLIGPATGSNAWIAKLGSFLKASPRVRIATVHRYPLRRCNAPRSAPFYPTIANLLAPYASRALAHSVAGAVTAAHARGVSLRVDELNSVACRGKRGVSDTLASALWVIDTLFNMAAVGVDGVNIHTFNGAVYEPFGFKQLGGREDAIVRPLYYGLLLFAQAAPAGARLLQTHQTPGLALHTWATRSPSGVVRMVLINDSPRKPLTLAVGPPGGASSDATLSILRAHGLGSKQGITIGGQTFGDASATGVLTGRSTATTLSPVQSRYVVKLPAASAALLTVQ